MNRSDLAYRTAGAENPKLLVVLCHGYGAPGTDLVGLGPELIRASPDVARSVRFAFPEAPLSLGEMGWGEARAWWPIDVDRFARVAQLGGAGALKALREERSEAMLEASGTLQGMVEKLASELSLPLSRVVLGGFSQGAMVATEVALALEERVAALIAFSGTLISESHWTERAALKPGTPVLVTHGRADPILPYANAEALRDLFIGAKWDVRWVPFSGGHTIAQPGLAACLELLRGLL